MANSTQSTPQLIAKGFSRMLIFTGAAVFLLGDRFLREIEHWSFFASEAAGILTGVALMLFGVMWALPAFGQSEAPIANLAPEPPPSASATARLRPGETVTLKPGADHLMLTQLKHPLETGNSIAATLQFEKAGTVKVEVPVLGMGAAAPGPAAGGSMMMMQGHGDQGHGDHMMMQPGKQ